MLTRNVEHPSARIWQCLVFDTKSYGINIYAPYCNTVPGNAKTVDAGSLVMRAFPIAGFYFQDTNGNNIAASEIQLTAPPSDGFMATVADGSVKDLSVGGDGKIVIRANRPGTYTWCETVAPASYFAPSPSCGTIDLSWDLSTGLIIKHQKKIIIKPF